LLFNGEFDTDCGEEGADAGVRCGDTDGKQNMTAMPILNLGYR